MSASSRLKIVADKDIPFLKGVFEPYFDVDYYKGGEITSDILAGASALLIRTRTKCNSALLEGTPVTFIASATIGTDHIDMEYLKKKGIGFVNAPGCNAGGVMQYVHTALFALAQNISMDLRDKTIGVIGVGNTGGRVAALAERIGLNVLRNDPPRAAKESGNQFCSLDFLLHEADIVTCHVPLDENTRGMASADFFSQMKSGAVFINASRGEIVDDNALLTAKQKLSGLILDVWNGEPSSISHELIVAADIATPHIAGYSYEGKINGTTAVVRALAHHFHICELFEFEPPHTPSPVIDFPKELNTYSQKLLTHQLLELFPIYELDSNLRRNPESFEAIRSGYVLRREFAVH